MGFLFRMLDLTTSVNSSKVYIYEIGFHKYMMNNLKD